MTSKMPTLGLIALRDSDLTLDDPAQDIRGRTLVDSSNTEIGEIKDLLIDADERKVRFMVVGVGGVFGVGEKDIMVPVDAITDIGDESVTVSENGEDVAGGPRYDPELLNDREYHRDVYDWYGYSAYWTAGYSSPTYWRRPMRFSAGRRPPPSG